MQIGGRVSLSRQVRIFWAMSLIAVALDQLTKAIVRVRWASPALNHPLDRLLSAWIEAAYAAGESVPVIGDALRLSFVRNEGAAFGMLPGYRPLFIVTSVLVLVVVWGYWRKEHPTAVSVVAALALVSAGAVGNLIDRAMFGRVTDFVDVAVIDFPVFNVADSSIFIGVGILIVHLLLAPEPPHDDGSGGDDRAESRT